MMTPRPLLTPYYQALQRQQWMKQKGMYYLNSMFVKLQDLIENELQGKGDVVEGALRSHIRAKNLNTGHYQPILHGSNVIPIQEHINARRVNKGPESEDEVRAFLRRHGIDYPAKTTQTPSQSIAQTLKCFKSIMNAASLAQGLHTTAKCSAEFSDDASENVTVEDAAVPPLEKLIIYRLLGMAPESADEIDDFLMRNSSVDAKPMPSQRPKLK